MAVVFKGQASCIKRLTRRQKEAVSFNSLVVGHANVGYKYIYAMAEKCNLYIYTHAQCCENARAYVQFGKLLIRDLSARQRQCKRDGY